MTVWFIIGGALIGAALGACGGARLESLVRGTLTRAEKERIKSVFGRRPELPDPVEVDFDDPSEEAKEAVRASLEDLDPEKEEEIVREIEEALEEDQQPA
jgi:hypothetical protein